MAIILGDRPTARRGCRWLTEHGRRKSLANRRKFQNPTNYSKSCSILFQPNSEEFKPYFDFSNFKLKFNDQLLSTKKPLDQNEVWKTHTECAICTGSYQQVRKIAKRKKVDRQKACDVTAVWPGVSCC